MTRHFTRRTNNDRKVARLQASWLTPTPADARWLAAVADIAVTAPDAALDTARYSYIPLDDVHHGTVITGASADRSMRCPTTVLIVANRHLDELTDRIEALGDAPTSDLVAA